MTFWDTKCETCLKKRAEMLQGLKSFFAKPYSDDMDALHWFFFFGLLILISFMWSRVLNTITKVV